MTQAPPWWTTTTIYQVYPRSFMDSNGDGIGDLRGIISKLDYIQDLGFETIWVSPIFRSPQQDFGYDVSDYTDIAPEYGTLADVDELIREIHARGMRVLFDLVLNHTSIQHPWFQESRSSRDNLRRDWYIWRDGKGKRPPNNWVAVPGGSGWHYDEHSEQYYYASFLPFQPDLNWRNTDVKQAMFDVVRFWLDKGVDGFRLDIFHTLYKDAHFRGNPLSFQIVPKDDRAGFFQKWVYSLNRPEVFELARELRSIVDSYSPARTLIGEVFGSDANVKKFLGDELDGLHLVFLWDLLNLKGSVNFLRNTIRHYEKVYPPPYTPVYVFGNHDRKRLMSHIREDPRLAKLMALFQYTVRGVPATYYGEEIGMVDGNFSDATSLDPIGQRYRRIPGLIKNLVSVYTNRDGCRTPMQWDDGPNGGFCSGDVTPWLPVHQNHIRVNVQRQQMDPASTLNTYKKLLTLRDQFEVLQTGSLQLLEGEEIDKDLLVYKRQMKGETVLVVINWGRKARELRNMTDCDQVLLTVGMEPLKNRVIIELPPLSGIVLGN